MASIRDRAWRISKAKHKNTALTGYGCQFASGRWHQLMVPMVYCSDSEALAALETFIHLQEDAKHIKFISIKIEIPPALILDVESIKVLPKQWRKQPPGEGTKKTGSDWIKSAKSAVLSVPSAIITSSRNYLLNPNHSDFKKIKVEKPQTFSFDTRLWK